MEAKLETKTILPKQWLAIYTKPRWEKKIDSVLIRKGIHSWCPIQKKERFWSDRKKIIDEPLFRSYVFVNIDANERTTVLTTPGVLNFVYYLGKPAIIRDEEIELIRKYLGEKGAALSVISEQGYQEETRVLVNHGVFMGNEGTVIRGGKKKVFVKLESLGQVMVVEFPTEFITPVV